jgi:AraC-like DNA-binding protein
MSVQTVQTKESKTAQKDDSEQAAAKTAIRPFRVDVPEAELTALRRRINATKWPERENRKSVSPQSCSVRVRRFQRALVVIRRSAVPNWPALALECGYCDQSHMIRDFLASSGFSPTEYCSRQRAFAKQGLRTKHNHMPLVE